MKNDLVIADTGPIISLAIIDKLPILNHLFNDIKIPRAVINELIHDTSKKEHQTIKHFFANKVCSIKGMNDLTFTMDYGEAEAVILYRELDADILLIDDSKARKIAENFDINCIGTLGILMKAKEKGVITELRPIFIEFIDKKRFYSVKLLNIILEKFDEVRL